MKVFLILWLTFEILSSYISMENWNFPLSKWLQNLQSIVWLTKICSHWPYKYTLPNICSGKECIVIKNELFCGFKFTQFFYFYAKYFILMKNYQITITQIVKILTTAASTGGGRRKILRNQKNCCRKIVFFPQLYNMTKILKDRIENGQKINCSLRFFLCKFQIFSKISNILLFFAQTRKDFAAPFL